MLFKPCFKVLLYEFSLTAGVKPSLVDKICFRFGSMLFKPCFKVLLYEFSLTAGVKPCLVDKICCRVDLMPLQPRLDGATHVFLLTTSPKPSTQEILSPKTCGLRSYLLQSHLTKRLKIKLDSPPENEGGGTCMPYSFLHP